MVNKGSARTRPGRDATLRPQAGPVGVQGSGKGGKRWGWKLRFSSGGLPRVGKKGEKGQGSSNLQGWRKGIQVPVHTLLRVIKGEFWG